MMGVAWTEKRAHSHEKGVIISYVGLNLCTTHDMEKKMSQQHSCLCLCPHPDRYDGGHLDAAEPSGRKPRDGSEFEKNLLASGGGMFAHTTHSGIIKGMLDNSTHGDLQLGYLRASRCPHRQGAQAVTADLAKSQQRLAITANSGGHG